MCQELYISVLADTLYTGGKDIIGTGIIIISDLNCYYIIIIIRLELL